MPKFNSFFRTALPGLSGLAGIVVLVALGLTNEYQSANQHARIELDNITRLLEVNALTTFTKADLLLGEIQRKIHPGELKTVQGVTDSDKQKFHAFLLYHSEGAPEIVELNVINAQGDYIYSSLDRIPAINISDRDYFRKLRDVAFPGLVISHPVLSSRTGQWTIILGRRLEDKDGSFAGLVISVLNLDYFQQFYRTLDLGNHGLVALYDREFYLAARYPANEREIGQSANIFARSFIEKGISHATYHTRSPLDGMERMFSFRQAGKLPLFVFAGLADEDYLAVWRQHAWEYGGGFVALCLLVFYFWLRQQQADQALRRESEKNLALLRNASDGIHILDTAGNVIEASNSFCAMLGYSHDDVIGMNVSKWEAQLSGTELAHVIENQFKKQGYSLFETVHRRKDGSTFDVEVSGLPLELDGKPLLFNSSRDITISKQQEAHLQQQLIFSQALNKISRTLVEQNDAVAILGETVRAIGEALEADRALIYEISFDQQQIVGLSEWLNPNFTDISSSISNYPLQFFAAGATALFRTKSWFVSHGNNINPHLLKDGSGELLHHKKMIKSLLWYPFAFREAKFYALVLNQTHTFKEWTKEEIGFLDSVSQLVSVELEKIHLMEERRQAEYRQRIAAIAFESQEGMLVTDAEGQILQVNSAFTKITGYELSEVVGKNPRMLGSGRQDVNFYVSMWEEIISTGTWEGEIWNRRKSGDVYPEYLTITAVRDEHGIIKNYVGTLVDITERKQHQHEIEHLAYHDPLTQLPNRSLLAELMHQELSRAKRSKEFACVACLDLDGFKTVNDTYGHDAGDCLLIEAGLRMKRCVRPDDTISRLGGDEFALLLCRINSRSDCEHTLNRVLEELKLPFDLGNGNIGRISGSIGYTLYPEDDADPDTLLRHADQAMYISKQAGKNRFHKFDLSSNSRSSANWDALKRIEKALDKNEFRLYIQPKIALNDGKVVGAEALIRWIHPIRALVPPNQFIPLIENQDIALKVGEWVIREGMTLLQRWSRLGLDFPLSVNVSARQLREKDFAERLGEILQEYPEVRPENLEIEIVESAALDDIQMVSKLIGECRSLGVRFSLDDFGTGYSSLTYLKRLSVDVLKIDQSFVRDMLEDDGAQSIVSGVIGLAQAFRLHTVAEGVETWQHAAKLKSLGCYIAQGYAIARPMPAEEVPQWIEKFDMPNI